MPIDPNIYAAGMRPVQQADSPMQTLAQISVIRNQQLQREEAQQRLEINRAAEARLNETARLDQQKRSRTAEGNAFVAKSINGALKPDGALDVDLLGRAVMSSEYADLWPELAPKFIDINEKLAKVKEQGGKNLTNLNNLIGSEAQAVMVFPKEQWIARSQDSIDHLVANDVLTREEGDTFINKMRDEPDQTENFLKSAIARSEKQQELKNAEPKPFSVSENAGVYDPVSKTWIREPTKKEPTLGTLEDDIVTWARDHGMPPEAVPAAIKNKLREDRHDDNPMMQVLHQMQIDNLKSGGKYTKEQNERFTVLSGAIERSPLVKAADRTLLLKAAVEKVEKDPANGSNQFEMIYGFIQAVDTYQSSVREGEMQNLGALGTYWEQLANKARRFLPKNLGGEGLPIPPEVATEIAATGKQLAATIDKGRAEKMASFRSRAQVQGIGDMFDEWQANIPKPGGGGDAKTGKIKARDPQGKLHEADAGTPLPAGWVLEK